MEQRLADLRARLTAESSIVLGPPATPDRVAGFEALHGVTLPEELRRFVLEVGDGIRVDDEPQLYALDEITTATGDEVRPAAPFPYGAADADAILAAIAAAGPGGPLGSRRVMDLQRAGDPDGCLVVASNGGNDFSVIVVTGDQRGRMWRTGELDAPETRALYQPGADDAPLGFLDWLVPWASCFLGVELDGDQASG